MAAQNFTLESAQDLLDSFDLGDDPDSRTFLAELLASGAAPKEEVDGLCQGVNTTGKKAKITPKTPKRKAKRLKTSSHKETGTSPFFEDRTVNCVNGADSSDKANSDADSNANDRPLPLRLTARTQTVAILTRRVVLGGSPEKTTAEDDAPAIPKLEPPSSQPTSLQSLPLLGVSSSSEPATRPSISSPSKTSKIKAKLSKKSRDATSHFFSPGKKKKRAVKAANPSSDTSDSDTFSGDSGSDSSSSPPTPTPSPSKQKLSRRGLISGLPFPPLNSPSFGLVQEQLADEPFWLLIALVFLTRVAGRVSLPVFWAVKANYPTPEHLLAADPAPLIASMRHLGMSTVRCTALQRYAQRWIERPPQAGVFTTVKHYPLTESDTADTDSQWEIGHITQGAYAVDSWRIFCRDRLRGLSTDWKGEAGTDSTFQPEWMRVLPQDKELRACLRWMWMREGWDWDPKTGDRTVLSEELRRAVNEGRVGYNNTGDLQIVCEDDTIV